MWIAWIRTLARPLPPAGKGPVMGRLKSRAFAVAYLLLMALCSARGLYAQVCLTLSSARVKPGNTATLDLSLATISGEPPAAVQWTFQYPAASIGSLTVEDGPALRSSRKTILCAGSAAANHCMIAGANPNGIPNGVVAQVTVNLTSTARTASIHLNDPMAASADGFVIPVHVANGVITVFNGFSQRQPNPSEPDRGPCSAQTQQKDK